MNKLLIGILLIAIQSCSTQKNSLIKGIDLTNPESKFLDIITIDKTNIYWLGEQHGTKDNYIVAIKFIKQLIQNYDLSYIIIENSFLTEILLNKYLQTGNEEFLKASIKNYDGTFYANVQLKNYLKSIYSIWEELPSNKKFQFVSIDIEQTYRQSENYIVSYLMEKKLYSEFEQEINFVIEKNNQNRKRYFTSLMKFLRKKNVKNDTINYMTQNIINTLTAYQNGENWDNVRDSLIYENFRIRNKTFDFKNNISFGFWGTDHCYKSANNSSVKWVASLIKKHHSNIKQNSTVILYDKCYFLRHKSKFPKLSRFLFKKIDDNYIRHKFQNEPFQKLKDKKHLRRNKTSRIIMWKLKNLNSKWNFITKKDKLKASIDYIDNVILITGSEHCIPYYGK